MRISQKTMDPKKNPPTCCKPFVKVSPWVVVSKTVNRAPNKIRVAGEEMVIKKELTNNFIAGSFG